MPEPKKTDVKQDIQSVQTVEEFDRVLEAYKLQNPRKFAEKLALGEFDKFRSTLAPKEEKKAEKAEKKK